MAQAKTKSKGPRPAPVIDPSDSNEVNTLLAQVQTVTAEMRQHEDAVVALGKKRRALVTRLRAKKITWTKIAWWADTTDQALYKHHNREK